MTNLTMLGLAVVAGSLSMNAATLTVNGTQNPWLITANPFQPDGDQPTLFTDFAAGDQLQFSVSGEAAANPGFDSDADGQEDFPIDHGSVTHISGIVGTPQNALMGVFVEDADPDSATDTPASLDFTSPAQRNFPTLAPALRQLFFIGDGKTTAGSVQSFTVPAGATRLFLGVLDRANWGNNTGGYTVNVSKGGTAPQLTPITSFSFRSSAPPIRSSSAFEFTATESAVLSDLRLRVQYSMTPTVESSWTDLPYNSQMARLDNTWTTTATDVPTGDLYFRTIAAAPGFPDQISTVIGPVTILPGIAPFGDFSYGTTAPARNGALWTFAITEPSDFVSLRVQSSTTPEVESSWSDLPAGGMMTRSGSNWSLASSNISAGHRSFRVIASAAGFPDRISAVLGPLDVQDTLPVVTKPQGTSGKYTLQSLDEKTPEMILAEAIGQANVHFALGDIEGGTAILVSATTLYAEAQASIDLTVGAGQSLTTPGLDMGPHSDLVLQGTINGDVGLLGPNAAPIISNDGASVIGNDGASLISNDGGSLQHDAASGVAVSAAAGLAAPAGAPLIAPNGASVVSVQADGLISPNGGTIISNDGASRPIGNVHAFGAVPVSTGVMTINGNYHQDAGTALIIAVTGTNSIPSAQYDKLVVSGRADLGGVIAYGFFNAADVQSKENVFYPQEGATIDVVVASKIATQNLLVRGPVWGDGLHFRWDIVDLGNGQQALRLTAVRVPPVLAIQQKGAQVQIAYPTNYTGYTLESANSLVPGNWMAAGASGNSATVPASSGAAFFRLRK